MPSKADLSVEQAIMVPVVHLEPKGEHIILVSTVYGAQCTNKLAEGDPPPGGSTETADVRDAAVVKVVIVKAVVLRLWQAQSMLAGSDCEWQQPWSGLPRHKMLSHVGHRLAVCCCLAVGCKLLQ